MWSAILAALPKIAITLLDVVGRVIRYMGDKQLLDAGTDRAVKEGLENVLESYAKAKRAADAMSGDSEWADGVRRKYLRDSDDSGNG